MRNLQIDKTRLAKNATKALDQLKIADAMNPCGYSYFYIREPESPEYRFLTSASLNHVWQSWNSFCRSFWITYLVGGKTTSRHRIKANAVNTNMTIEDLLAAFLNNNSGYGTRNRASSLKYYQEPTWGDPEKLEKALSLAEQTVEIQRFELLLTQYSREIKDMQHVRNAMIHPTKGAIHALKAEIGPRYSIRPLTNNKPPYALSIVYSTHIATGDIAIERWVASILAVSRTI